MKIEPKGKDWMKLERLRHTLDGHLKARAHS